MALHHLTEYRIDGGEWITAYADEEAGPGKSFPIHDLTPGSYSIQLRVTPLNGSDPAVISDPVTLVVSGTQSIVGNATTLQLKQTESAQGSIEFKINLNASQTVQALAAAGSMLFSGSVNATQQNQTASISATNGDVTAGLIETQAQQTVSIVAAMMFDATLNATQAKQSENISSSLVLDSSASETQQKQTEASASSLAFPSSASVTQQKQTETLAASLLLSGAASYSQQKQTASIAGTAAASAPTQVTGVTASNSPAQITVSWTAVSGATSYNVYYSTANNSSGATKISNASTGTSYSINGPLASGTAYYVWVSAQNSGGEGTLSTGYGPVTAAAAVSGDNFDDGTLQGWVAGSEEGVYWGETGTVSILAYGGGGYYLKLQSEEAFDSDEETSLGPVRAYIEKTITTGATVSVRVLMNGITGGGIPIAINGTDQTLSFPYDGSEWHTVPIAVTPGTNTIRIYSRALNPPEAVAIDFITY